MSGQATTNFFGLGKNLTSKSVPIHIFHGLSDLFLDGGCSGGQNFLFQVIPTAFGGREKCWQRRSIAIALIFGRSSSCCRGGGDGGGGEGGGEGGSEGVCLQWT